MQDSEKYSAFMLQASKISSPSLKQLLLHVLLSDYVLTHVVSFGSYVLNLGYIDINGKIAINWDFAVFIVLWCLSVFYFFNFIFSEYSF